MRHSRLLLLIVFVLVSTPLFAERPAIPVLSVEGDDGNIALELTALEIHVTIRGHLARTEYALTYHNSLDRVTGGEFRFPLPADAEISDLGLYFDGRLRHGVAVERTLARNAYEETVHRGVDPALAEWSSERAFKLNVFPIPPNGEKKVFIAYDQELTAGGYALDLRYGKAMQFDATIDTDGRALEVDGALKFMRAGSGYAMHTRGETIDGMVRVAREESETALVAYSPEDQLWYASAAIDVRAPDSEMAPAPRVVILYDTSSSSARQNAQLLRRFLSAFLARQQAWASAEVIPFHSALEAPRRIDKVVTPAGQRELERVLGEQQPLGATNLFAAIAALPAIAAAHPPSTRIVLVTDGMTPLGDSREIGAAVAKLSELRRPLLVVNASSEADDRVLANAVRATGGWSIDLDRDALDHIEPEAAAAAAMRTPAKVRFGEGILPASVVTVGDERFVIAARAKESVIRMPHELPLREIAESSMVRRAWARAKLRELLAHGASDVELVAHGRAFTQLTPRTSLLVLESWRDYENYEIPMPPDVLEEKKREERGDLVPVSLREWPRGWWFITGRVFEDGHDSLPGVTVTLRDGDTPRADDVTDAEGRFSLGSATVPHDPIVVAELAGFNRFEKKLSPNTSTGTIVDIVMPAAAVAETITVTASQAWTADGGLEEPARAGAVTTDVELTRQALAKLRAINSTSERLRYYLSARERLGGNKAFHVFAAEMFRERAPELAARILGDLAEAWPDDAPLLRILARVLDGWNEPELARLILQRVLELAPDEPQSWRESILLEAKQGRSAGVAAAAQRVLPSENEDRDIAEIYEEIKENLARFERQRGGDLRADPRDDLTIELMWDAGWSWVDIHIAEPGGETVKWDHMKSAAGGMFIGGYIYGYGPEIYTIRNAPRGDYRLDIDYYMADNTDVSLQTLAHVIVYVRGQRHEHFVVLQTNAEHRTLETIRMP
jgi:hypothetical protein